MNVYQKLAQGNPDKYPSRLGAPWDEAECKKLLQLIKSEKSIEDVAKEHNRTPGAISARLRHLAAEYYEKDYSIDDIEELTGLSRDIIGEAIARHSSAKEKPKSKKKTSSVSTNNEVVKVLNDIKSSIDKLIKLLGE
jgi:predicted DNA-binding protein YlxM (UPF0122 family)